MKRIQLKISCTFLLCAIVYVPVQACTIFLLTDANRTLYFNNEDYSNPATRIWFIPGSKEYYGLAYVGFDDDWAQGGVNSAGLAFDWVAGLQEQYVPDSKLIHVRNNPSERMLESCATVKEAIAFYKKYKEPSFSTARIMIADKSGASVIIGAHNGHIYFDTSKQSRGFGYGKKALDGHLAKAPKPTIESGLPILQACLQQGEYATKYSSIYDLRTGDIFLALPGSQEAEIKINLSDELAKGGHYYDIPDIKKQLGEGARSLRNGMKRYMSDGYVPVSNPDPGIDRRLRAVMENSIAGTLNAEDFSPELWSQLSPNLKAIQDDSKKLGNIGSFTLIERKETVEQRSYLYVIEFEKFTVLFRFVLNDKNRLTMIKSEAAKPK